MTKSAFVFVFERNVNDCKMIEKPENDMIPQQKISCIDLFLTSEISAQPRVISIIPEDKPCAKDWSMFSHERKREMIDRLTLRSLMSYAISINI